VQDDVAIVLALAAFRRQPPAFAHHDQQVVHRAGLQFLGQVGLVGIDDVAHVIDHADVALRLDRAGLAVPRDRIGADRLFLAPQHDIARAVTTSESFAYSTLSAANWTGCHHPRSAAGVADGAGAGGEAGMAVCASAGQAVPHQAQRQAARQLAENGISATPAVMRRGRKRR
jgi:hypothetical protein